jgi:hypothetical protein
MNERTNDVERDELVARLADAVLARTEAESNLRVRARMHASTDDGRGLGKLIEAACQYHAASEAEESVQRGEPIEIIWGRGLVMGEAIGVANEIRDRRINALRASGAGR